MKTRGHVKTVWFISFWVVCGWCLSASAADAGRESSTSPVTLRLWNIPLKGSTNPLQLATRRVFEAFCRKNPDIHVKALIPLKIEGQADEGREFLAIAGGVAPDVFYLYGRKIGDYYDQGFLEPLDSYLEAYKKHNGRSYQGINAPSKVWELCQIDGRIYCVPTLYYSMALMCRRDLFARAGLPMRSPKDWDEFYHFARRLTWNPSKEPDARPGDPNIYGLQMTTGVSAGWHFLQYTWSAGGEIVRSFYPKPGDESTELIEVPPPPVDYREHHVNISDADRYYPRLEETRKSLQEKGIPSQYSMTDLKWRLVVNQAGGVEALEFYRRLIHQAWVRCPKKHENREFDLTPEDLKRGWVKCPVCGEKINLSSREGKKRIYRGVVQAGQPTDRQTRTVYAMQIGTLQEIPSNSDMKVLVTVPFPSMREDIPAVAFIAGHYLAINATQKDPRVREAAWKYIQFVTGPEAQAIRVRTYIENGLAEYIRPATLQALGYELELSRIPPERRELWKRLRENPKVEPYCKGFQHVMTRQLSMPIEAIILDPPDEDGRYQRDPRQLLDAIAHDANTLKLDKPPAEVMARRERIGWIIGVLVVGFLIFAVWFTIRFAVQMARKAADLEGFGVQGTTMRRLFIVVLFLLPAVGSVLLWGYYPLARGTIMAFQDYKIMTGSKWVGLENFILTAGSVDFWRYVLQTFQYMLMSLAMGFFAPILLAILLTEVPKGKVLYRTLYYLPAVTTGLVVMFMWKNLLYDSSDTGLINQMILTFNDRPPGTMILLKLLLVGILSLTMYLLVRAVFSPGTTKLGRLIPMILAVPLAVYLAAQLWTIVTGPGLFAWFQEPWEFQPQKFLGDPNLAMFWIIVPGLWAGVGPGCLIYLAALKGVPHEQYEAADLDGAGIWSKVVNVTFPNLSALMIINLVGAVVGAMKASQQIFVMTGGGPEDVTMTVGLNIWFNAFMFLNFGLATSQAWILGAMLIGFTLYQLRLMNKMQFSTASAKGGK
ncbi:MAG: extracellular solute-binding protein [Phycisphaerae bacterium]|nr:extracellular solute-binding protein [Phycisphaerae bacterium]